MDRKTMGLGIALGYPGQAFADLPDAVIKQAEELVRRAGGGEQMADEASDFLRSHPELNEWVEQLLEDSSLRPPHLRPRKVRSYKGLLGEPTPVSAPQYVCTKGHFTWYQAFNFEVVPDCKFCERKLILAQ